jgi:hypothetical protein
MIRRALFWTSAFAVVFAYVGAPLVIFARALLRPRTIAARRIEPPVSIVIAARNEEASIGERLDNLASLDYPDDCLQVIVASDGSDDATVAIASTRASDRVTVLDLERVGKADALNEAVSRATGEIVVFTDANTAFAPDAVRALVAPFADPGVGGVAGNQVYTKDGRSAGEAGERSYWDFDRFLKRAESAAGSTVSAGSLCPRSWLESPTTSSPRRPSSTAATGSRSPPMPSHMSHPPLRPIANTAVRSGSSPGASAVLRRDEHCSIPDELGSMRSSSRGTSCSAG